MAKHRKMFYHMAGAPSITVEHVTRAEVDGEVLEKTTNSYVDSPAVMAKLAELEALLDADVGTDGADPIEVSKFATAEVEPVTEEPVK